MNLLCGVAVATFEAGDGFEAVTNDLDDEKRFDGVDEDDGAVEEVAALKALFLTIRAAMAIVRRRDERKGVECVCECARVYVNVAS